MLLQVGTRLEAIDQNEKMLCPATVKVSAGSVLSRFSVLSRLV